MDTEHTRWPWFSTSGLLLAWLLTMFVPRALPIALVIAVCTAVLGTRRSRNPHWRSLCRHALLAASAFGYPIFLGGRMLPWVAMGLSFSLIVLAWVPRVAGRARLVLPQALAAALGIALTASATQFFFPTTWRTVACLALIAFGILLVVSTPQQSLAMLPAPFTCAAVLVLAETLVLLRSLPAHWTINGAILASAIAVMLMPRRTARLAFSGLLVAIFAFGVVQ
ncbi:MAG: hypothetical protein Q7S96_00015 [bacterium]|nr:hypothetical protein [bacterium]